MKFFRSRIPKPPDLPSRKAADRQPSEATRARLRAQQELELTKAQTPKFRAFRDVMREIRETNHFRDDFVDLLKGHSK